MPFFEYLTDDSGVTDIARAEPEKFVHLGAFTQAVLRGPSPLSKAERELIAAYVSGVNDCEYCHGVHTATAANFGVEAALLENLLADLKTASVDARLQALLVYARKLTQTPSRMVPADAQAVFDAGCTPEELRDTVTICALFNFYNRLIEGHGLKGHADLFTRNGARLAKDGYGKAAEKELGGNT
jgi:uncharacterized peroxidase-related enzyme